MTRVLFSVAPGCTIRGGALGIGDVDTVEDGSVEAQLTTLQMERFLFCGGAQGSCPLDADFNRLCGALFTAYNNKVEETGGLIIKGNGRNSVCGAEFGLFKKGATASAAPATRALVRCNQKGTVYSDLAAVLKVCTKPCFQDPTQSCCFVPQQLGSYFTCCVSKGCCPDGKRRRVQGSSGAGTSASNVQVEASDRHDRVLSRLMDCLGGNQTIQSCFAQLRAQHD